MPNKNHEKIAAMRREYVMPDFSPEDAEDHPMQQFAHWFGEAVEGKEPEPNAMVLATVSAECKPHARIVLLKGYGEEGFYYYTNYQSAKAKDVDWNPNVSLLFNWLGQHRQIRVEGRALKTDAKYADAYYNKRPRGSRIGAWSSPQSRPIPDRAFLERRVEQIDRLFEGREEIPRPPFWGGYLVVPQAVEFWQGRSSRLHDRVRYEREADERWRKFRLAP